jgi:hypothetical protein
VKHGTASGYNRGCRCDECRVAHTEYNREYMKRWMAENRERYAEIKARHRAKALAELQNPDDPRHGRAGTYALGCRCERCREAHSRADRERRERFRVRCSREGCEKVLRGNYRNSGLCAKHDPKAIEARRVVNQRSRDKALAELRASDSDPRHGTETGYVLGCRCERCRGGAAEQRRLRKMGMDA